MLVGLVPDDAGDDAGAVGEAEPEELEEGEGDGDDGLGVGVGVGVDVAAAGTTSHLVSVFAPALVEVLGLAEAASAFIVPACAAPGQPDQHAEGKGPPGHRAEYRCSCVRQAHEDRPVSAARRGYCVLFMGFVGDWVTDGYEYSYPVPGQLCVCQHVPFTAGPPWRFGVPAK